MDDQWSDRDTPLVSPDAKFRQELARSLQDTHHRQRILRQAHRSPATYHDHPPLWTFAAAISLLLLAFGIGYYTGRRAK